MRLDETRPALTDQQRFEDAVAAYRGQVISAQQRLPRVVHPAVGRDKNRGLAGHGIEA